jgi:hypothetical protein
MGLQEDMDRVKQALGEMAIAVDDSPWINTHAALLAAIAGLAVAQPVKDTFIEFFNVIAILNTKMLNVFAALNGFGTNFSPQFLTMVQRQKVYVAGGAPSTMQPAESLEAVPAAMPPNGAATPATLGLLADTLRAQVKAHYTDYLTQAQTTAVVDLDDAVAALG